MKKFYIGFCVMLLVALLSVGLWTMLVNGVPEIGLHNYNKGEYASRFHNVMAEAFSKEESLVSLSTKLNGFYSFTGFSKEEEVQMLVPIVNDGADHGAQLPEIPMTEDESTPSDVTEALGEDAISIPETIPEETESTPQTEPTDSEETVTEEEPAVEALGQILLMGDRAMELPDANYDAISQYAVSVNGIADALEGITVYSLLVPNSAGLYAPEAYCSGEDDQYTMINYAYDGMNERVSTIDAYTVLQDHKDEYLYFRTDHHWTHLGSYYAYTAFCDSAGLTAQPLSKYESGTYDTFLGTMYSFLSGYSQRQILKNHPDYLTYYIPYADTTVRYYDSQSMAYGGKIDMVYSLSENYSNKYICFLGGDHPITVIETDYPEERVCLLIKESYGNAFATWLTGHYSKIICIDPREFNRNEKPSLDLQAFAEKQGVDDCIILNYPLMINSTAYAAWLGRLVK